MANVQSYDAIVIGGGAIGLGAARELGRRRMATVVLEAQDLFHDLASSSGTERHWRIQYSQEDLAKLALDTMAGWDQLEREAGRRLRHRVGSLWLGDVDVQTNEGQISAAANIMDKLSVPYEWLTAREIEKRFQFTNLPGHYEGFLQPDGAIIDVKGTLLSLYELAVAAGVRVQPRTRVRELYVESDHVRLVTSSGVFQAPSVVVAAGPDTARLLAPLGVHMDYRVFDMADLTFSPMGDVSELPFWFAFQQPLESDTNLFYGFGPRPWSPSAECRVAPDFEVDEVAPDAVATRDPKPRDVERVREWVTDHMRMLDPHPTATRTCLAVLPRDPDRQFYLSNVALGSTTARIATFAAGWGFKFVPLIGRVLADWACTGRTDVDVRRLSV